MGLQNSSSAQIKRAKSVIGHAPHAARHTEVIVASSSSSSATYCNDFRTTELNY
jgi:hypothetical protein